MKRSRLRVGDKSSVGGIVVEGIPFMMQDGIQLTFLGATVSCPACHSTGQIAPTGPRWPSNFMGKQSALEGDLCICKCNPAPVMKASQETLFETFDSSHLSSLGFPSASATQADTHGEGPYDQHFQLVDQDGAVLENVPVSVQTPDGSVVESETNASGKTQKFAGLPGHTVGLGLYDEGNGA